MAEEVALYREPTTRRDLDSTWFHHLGPHFGGLAIGDLNDAHVVAYIQLRKRQTNLRQTKTPRPVSDRSINKELDYFAGFLTWAGIKARIPFDRPAIVKLKYTRPIPIILTAEEVVRFLAAAEPFWRAYFGALYLMGLRANEARMMTWEKTDLEARTALVIGKGSRERLVGIPHWLADLLDTMRPDPPVGYIFLSSRTKKRPITNGRRAIDRARAAAGITKRIYPHLLRHTCGAHLVGLNENLRRIQEMFGHADIHTTRWYTQVGTADLLGTADHLGDAFDRARALSEAREPIE
jgi:integrase/recombinase XerC